jgi:cation:H+ antiporter
MLLNVLLLIVGFFLLIKGADYFVESASTLAKKNSISQIVIGLTVVAFGTSLPELVINIFAAYKKQADVSFGNTIGSNIFNIFLVLGIAGFIRPLTAEKNTIWREIPFTLLAVMALFVLCNDIFFNNTSNVLSGGDGIILLLFFSVFIIYVFAISKVSSRDVPEIQDLSKLKIIIFLIVGLAGLIIGGHLVVLNAVKIANFYGLSSKLIGLTIIASGTSLPELITSAVAAYKGKTDIAVGNIIGSNVFNILFILAITAVIVPLPFDHIMNIDLAVLLLASILLFFTMFTGKKRSLDRWEAIIFIILYCSYTIYLIIRN